MMWPLRMMMSNGFLSCATAIGFESVTRNSTNTANVVPLRMTGLRLVFDGTKQKCTRTSIAGNKIEVRKLEMADHLSLSRFLLKRQDTGCGGPSENRIGPISIETSTAFARRAKLAGRGRRLRS